LEHRFVEDQRERADEKVKPIVKLPVAVHGDLVIHEGLRIGRHPACLHNGQGSLRWNSLLPQCRHCGGKLPRRKSRQMTSSFCDNINA
jgi:hypothetical protein